MPDRLRTGYEFEFTEQGLIQRGIDVASPYYHRISLFRLEFAQYLPSDEIYTALYDLYREERASYEVDVPGDGKNPGRKVRGPLVVVPAEQRANFAKLFAMELKINNQVRLLEQDLIDLYLELLEFLKSNPDSPALERYQTSLENLVGSIEAMSEGQEKFMDIDGFIEILKLFTEQGNF
jgi:hypothetical protein